MQKIATETKDTKLNAERWLDEHGEKLYSYAQYRVLDPPLAEDMVQETLLSALKASERFAGRSSVRTWLMSILKHKISDHFRQLAKEDGLIVKDLEDDTAFENNFDAHGNWKADPSHWSDPSRSLELQQMQATMTVCIGDLPNSLRTLFILREIDGMDTVTLMETLQISSKNNFCVMMSRARERLRQCMRLSWFNEEL